MYEGIIGFVVGLAILLLGYRLGRNGVKAKTGETWISVANGRVYVGPEPMPTDPRIKMDLGSKPAEVTVERSEIGEVTHNENSEGEIQGADVLH